MDILSWLDGTQFWHWWILALIFAGIEILAPGVFFIWLGWLGIQAPSAVRTVIAQVGTIYYFAFFLLMPWWSRLGEFKPVPERVVYHGH